MTYISYKLLIHNSLELIHKSKSISRINYLTWGLLLLSASIFASLMCSNLFLMNWNAYPSLSNALITFFAKPSLIYRYLIVVEQFDHD